MYNTDRINYKKHCMKAFICVRLDKSNVVLYFRTYDFILKLTYINWLLYDNA